MYKPYNDISSCPDHAQMDAYVRSGMTQDMMHRMEKHMLFCEMCSDYAEGMEAMQKNDFSNTLKFSSPEKNNRRRWLYLVSAAAIVFVVLFSTRLWIRRADEKSAQQAMQQQSSANLSRQQINPHSVPFTQTEVLSPLEDKGEQPPGSISSPQKKTPNPVQSLSEAVTQFSEENIIHEASREENMFKKNEMDAVPKTDFTGKTGEMDVVQQDIPQSSPARAQMKTPVNGSPLSQGESLSPVEEKQESKSLKELDKPLSDASMADRLLKSAKEFYNQAEWSKAARCLQKVLSKTGAEKFDDNNRWMLANSLLRMGNLVQAIEQYEYLVKTGSVFKEQASDSIRKYKIP